MSWSPNKHLYKSFIHSVSPDPPVNHTKRQNFNSRGSFICNKVKLTKNLQQVPVGPQIFQAYTFKHKENRQANTIFTKACTEYIKGNYKEALKYFESVQTSITNDFQAQINISACKINLNQYENALNILENLTDSNPFNEILLFNKALIHSLLGNYKRSVEVLSALSEFFGNFSEDCQKLRTFAIIHSGKVSTALKDTESESGYTNRSPTRFDHQPSNINILQPKQKTRTFSSLSGKEKFNFLTFISNKPKNPEKKIFGSPQKLLASKKLNKFYSNKKIMSKVRTNQKTDNKRNDFIAKKIKNQDEKIFSNAKTGKNEEPGLYQRDLSIHCAEKLVEYEENFDNHDEKIRRIKTQASDYFSKVLANTDFLKLALESSNITQQDLKFLVDEFELSSENRNLEKIDEVLMKLEFFQKYREEIRYPVYKMSFIKQFPTNYVVFNQGDIGENLYIIIQGSVNVIKSSEEFRNHSVIVSSIYSGQHFGDIALLNSLKSNPFSSRTATIKTTESCHFLIVPKASYQSLLLSLQLKNLQSRTLFLSELKFFAGVDPTALIPLACNIQEQKFGVKDVIFKKGFIPEGLIIIVKGQAKLVAEACPKLEKNAQYMGHRKKKSLPGSVARINYGVKRHGFKSCDISDAKFGVEDEMERKEKVVENFYFQTLFAKDFCAGRALCSDKVLPSKLSLISDSPDTEILTIGNSHMFYLPESVQSSMKNILKQSYEPDCPNDINSKTIEKFICNWQQFRKNLVNEIQAESYQDKHRFFS